MKNDGQLTDAAGYASTVRRRKMLTAMIMRAAEVSNARRAGYSSYDRAARMTYDRAARTIGPAVMAAPMNARQSEFRAYIDWEEAWVIAIKEERQKLCQRQARHRHKEPWGTSKPLKYFRAVSQPKKKESGATP